MKEMYANKTKKSNLHYTRTRSSATCERCPSPQLCARSYTLSLQRWRLAAASHRDFIGLGFEPHTFRSRSKHLITCAIWSGICTLARKM